MQVWAQQPGNLQILLHRARVTSVWRAPLHRAGVDANISISEIQGMPRLVQFAPGDRPPAALIAIERESAARSNIRRTRKALDSRVTACLLSLGRIREPKALSRQTG